MAINLTDAESDQSIEITTPHGTFTINVGLSHDGALTVFVNTNDMEPTPDVLRVNVNDGPVFNYDDAVNWYGEDQGYDAPSL